MKKDSVTPVRRQYLNIKRNYPDDIVFFRLGDFYETFDDDAKKVARDLDIVLTSREMGKGNKVPLAGIPYHALDNYLGRLVNKGHKVVICEQMTKPGETKGIVERDVVRVVTPGTLVEPGLLDSRANNYLVAIVPAEEQVGLAYVDITTSEFACAQLPRSRAVPELERLNPSELLAAEDTDISGFSSDVPVTRLEGYRFEEDIARQLLLDHFRVATLDGYGCSGLPLAVRAAGAILHYISTTQKAALGQITGLSTYSTDSFMALDVETQSNLELFRSGRNGGREGSLLGVLDLTGTPMGGRLLRRWLSQPLLDLPELLKRQDEIEWFYENNLPRRETATLLGRTSDIERVANRVRSGIATPRELVALSSSLLSVPELDAVLGRGTDAARIDMLKGGLKPRQEVVDLIAEAIADEPATSPGEGNVIREGFSEELDRLKSASRNARQFLAGLEKSEQETTGIKNLKVGYNKVFGYYIEISNPNLAQVPERYIRKQTLVNGERFFTPELKEYESLILNAREGIEELETNLYKRVLGQLAASSDRLLELAGILARLDVVSSLAEAAVRYGYVRPELDEGNEIVIRGGRHPVVERSLTESSFVPNDTDLSNDDSQLVILTGPNMAGKSTYLKQIALIVLMAQTGSFVPADSAKTGIVDRIFTRIGAREDLTAGQSTFMMEMVETANILNNATPRSLIILDEIGRGTSTYDGLSIARAVAEYLHNHAGLGAKTVFATHYHEMTELASFLPRVKNFNVAVTEEGGDVVFLRKIVPGGVDKSYGIHVARLAGLPKAVVHRAHEVLEELESDGAAVQSKKSRKKVSEAPQLSLFGGKSPVLEELEKIDINSLTPLEALTRLYELQTKARKG